MVLFVKGEAEDAQGQSCCMPQQARRPHVVCEESATNGLLVLMSVF